MVPFSPNIWNNGHMYRQIFNELKKWKESSNRFPLVVKGARQVGKTYSIKEFAQQNFSKLNYFNFEEKPELKKIFDQDLEPSRILKDLRLDPILLQNNQEIVFFDEIQACPKAITSLKYFAEKLPELHIISAGSLLGVVISNESYPVGKVKHLYMTPLKFSEFLQAYDSWSYDVFQQIKKDRVASEFHHEKILALYKLYLAVGGMPKAVLKAIEIRDNLNELSEQIKDVHNDLLKSYHSDFAKHAGKVNAVHISGVFANVAAQLARTIDGSTKRYIFKDVLPGQKSFAQLSAPIDWLVKAGLIYKVKITNRSEYPLESFTSENMFKLYFFDSGLLGRSLNIPFRVLVDESYGIAKGYFAENSVLTQIVQDEYHSVYCWEENKAEIEFLTSLKDRIVPIEVKSGQNLASKSLASYVKRYTPSIAVRLSSRNFVNSKPPVRDIPIYLSECLEQLVLDN